VPEPGTVTRWPWTKVPGKPTRWGPHGDQVIRDHQRHPLDRCDQLEHALIRATEQLEEARALLDRWAACADVWARQRGERPAWLRARLHETRTYLNRQEEPA